MKETLPELKQSWSVLMEECRAALHDYLTGQSEAALQRAYELSRKAMADGLGVLDMAVLLHRALLEIPWRRRSVEERAQLIKATEEFFLQCLSPFEMTHRAAQEANIALRASEERYRELFENANDIVFTTDLEGNLTSVNRAGERLSGYRRDETAAMNITQVVAPEYLELVRRMLEQKLGAGGSTTYELEMLTKSGERVPVEVSTRLIYQEGKPVGVQGIARDVTERKQAQEALRRLNARREEEIKRIAHGLHDEAGQLLASLHLALEEVARELPAPAGERLKAVREILDEIEQQLRRLSHELRPTILDDLGLVPALEFLADGVSKRSGLSITVEGSMGGRLPPAIETALYRVAQEALTNVAKHARAACVRIRLEREGGVIRCSIRDGGIGFDVPAVLTRRGESCLGLIGMRERVGAVGGTLQINSAPGHGTELIVTIPLEP